MNGRKKQKRFGEEARGALLRRADDDVKPAVSECKAAGGGLRVFRLIMEREEEHLSSSLFVLWKLSSLSLSLAKEKCDDKETDFACVAAQVTTHTRGPG